MTFSHVTFQFHPTLLKSPFQRLSSAARNVTDWSLSRWHLAARSIRKRSTHTRGFDQQATTRHITWASSHLDVLATCWSLSTPCGAATCASRRGYLHTATLPAATSVDATINQQLFISTPSWFQSNGFVLFGVGGAAFRLSTVACPMPPCMIVISTETIAVSYESSNEMRD